MSENKTKYLDVVGLNHVWTKIKDGFERKGLAQEITDSLRDELSAQIKHSSGLVNITYSELKSKRDNGQLIPGAFYRITDYMTTTSQKNTQSAGHQFDLIVTADDEKTLNEKARAIQHEGDTYFADSDLNAWEIWYCLDNDTERFDWAYGDNDIHVLCKIGSDDYFPDDPDEVKNKIIKVRHADEDAIVNQLKVLYVYTLSDGREIYFAEDGDIYDEGEREIGRYTIINGKGVIYRMIDEFGNDCPYDFKNIQFVRYELNAPETADSEHWMTKLSTNIQAQFNNNALPYIWGGISYGENRYWEDDYQEVYSTSTGNKKAFYTFSTVINGIVTDHSLLQGYCYGNTMKECDTSKKQRLNNNVFFNTSKASYCHSNSFENGCEFNSFGTKCHSNSFGNGCEFNSFGNDCLYNTFKDGCYYNSFGKQCSSNFFGDGCCYNSFGNICYSNSFGNYCEFNSFGDNCDYNSFGNNCLYNSFGNSCQSNSFGDSCRSNSFGNGCCCNSFRVSADNTSALKDYVRYNHFDDGCSYNVIWNSDTTSSKILLKNINVNRGVVGTNSSYNYINITTLNQDYEIQVAKNSKGEIKIYCEADLIA